MFTSNETLAKVDSISKNLIIEGEEIYKNELPLRIVALDKILKESTSFNLKHSSNVCVPVTTVPYPKAFDDCGSMSKKRKLDASVTSSSSSNGDAVVNVPSNKHLTSMMSELKSEIITSMEMLSKVKMWIQLNVPKIEDGNNFGVSIQEECITEVSRVEDSSFSVLDSMSKYYTSRARIVSKIIKHPSIDDYRQSLVELDEMEYINLRFCLTDLRNNHALLYDLITKNIAKLKKPRRNEGFVPGMY